MSLITITSTYGSSADKIARIVSNELELELYDNFKIESISKELNSAKENLKLIQEKSPNLLDKILLGNPEFYFEFTESVIYEIAKKGSGVIIGYAGQMLLRNFDCAFKVLIHAPLEDRITEVMKRELVDRDKALNLIKHNDNKQKDFYKYLFKTELESVDLYDLVINTSKISIQNSSDLIVESIRLNTIKECTRSSINNLNKLSIQKRISALLFVNNFDINDFNIKVEEDGTAEIDGFIENDDEGEKITTIVKNIDGIKNISTNFKVRIPYHGFNGYSM